MTNHKCTVYYNAQMQGGVGVGVMLMDYMDRVLVSVYDNIILMKIGLLIVCMLFGV